VAFNDFLGQCCWLVEWRTNHRSSQVGDPIITSRSVLINWTMVHQELLPVGCVTLLVYRSKLMDSERERERERLGRWAVIHGRCQGDGNRTVLDVKYS